jgi:hypothetical protein
VPARCTTRDNTVQSCVVSLKSPSGLRDKRVQDFSIYSSGGYFMQLYRSSVKSISCLSQSYKLDPEAPLYLTHYYDFHISANVSVYIIATLKPCTSMFGHLFPRGMIYITLIEDYKEWGWLQNYKSTCQGM